MTESFPSLRPISYAVPSKIIIREYSTIDIETFNDSGLARAYAIGIYHKGDFTYYYLTDYASDNDLFIAVLNYITEAKIKMLWSHNGGNFDIKLLLKGWESLLKTGEITIKRQFVRGSRIYSVQLCYKNHSIIYRDSMLLLNHKLSALAKNFNTSIPKGVFPHKFAALETLEYIGIKPVIDMFYDITPVEYADIPDHFCFRNQVLSYLRADCIALSEILYNFQTEMLRVTKIDPLASYSLASLSNKIWRLLDATNASQVSYIPTTTQLCKDICKAYYGGICDIYKTNASKASVWDVNSMYPSIMKDCKFPKGSPLYMESTNLDDYYGFCYAKIDSGSVYGRALLPYKLNGTLITPLGEFEGWYYSEELKLVRSLGYNISVVKGYH